MSVFECVCMRAYLRACGGGEWKGMCEWVGECVCMCEWVGGGGCVCV